jgi:hypothetical protein
MASSFQRFWTGLTDSARGWITIGIIASIVLIVVLIILSLKPWESQNYKDCLHAYEFQVDGSPGHTRSDMEQYCKQSTGG